MAGFTIAGLGALLRVLDAGAYLGIALVSLIWWVVALAMPRDPAKRAKPTRSTLTIKR